MFLHAISIIKFNAETKKIMNNAKKQEIAFELRNEDRHPVMADTSLMSRTDAEAEARRFMQACVADANARGYRGHRGYRGYRRRY